MSDFRSSDVLTPKTYHGFLHHILLGPKVYNPRILYAKAHNYHSRRPMACQSQHPTRQRRPPILIPPPKALGLRIDRPDIIPTHSADMAFLRCRMLPKHEHRFPAFLVKLLEQNERSFIQPQTPLLVTVDNV